LPLPLGHTNRPAVNRAACLRGDVAEFRGLASLSGLMISASPDSGGCLSGINRPPRWPTGEIPGEAISLDGNRPAVADRGARATRKTQNRRPQPQGQPTPKGARPPAYRFRRSLLNQPDNDPGDSSHEDIAGEQRMTAIAPIEPRCKSAQLRFVVAVETGKLLLDILPNREAHVRGQLRRR
jgi:hypothetical protein